jgi:hypothetical protein
VGRPRLQLVGQKFGKLTVIEPVLQSDKWQRYFFKCLCDCGRETRVSGTALKRLKTVSCGCALTEHLRQLNLSKRLPDFKGAKRRLFLRYAAGARMRGISFDLSFEDFVEVVQKACRYCGRSCVSSQSAYTKRSAERFAYTGIDRLNNSIGYSKENSVSCCAICNKSKGTMSEIDFLNWINLVHNHRATKQ